MATAAAAAGGRSKLVASLILEHCLFPWRLPSSLFSPYKVLEAPNPFKLPKLALGSSFSSSASAEPCLIFTGFSSLYGRACGPRLCHGASNVLKYSGHASRRLRVISSKADEKSQKQQQGSDRAPQGEEMASPFNTGIKYSVIRINSNGRWEQLQLNTYEIGIHPRDMDLLAGNFFIPKRSAIAVRSDKVLVRMENVRALVCKDYCLLFDAHRPRKGTQKQPQRGSNAASFGKPPPEALIKSREAFANFLAEYAKRLPSEDQEQMPFHLQMIECLLDETSHFFNQKVERLKIVVERMLEELTGHESICGLQRLLPLKRALTEVEHDVQDTHEALEQVLGSDDILDALCFEGGQPLNMSESSDEHRLNRIRQAAADMLITYLREIDDAGGVLEELRKDLDAAQEVWELGLDTTRNRIIRMNLFISIATVSLTLATVPASFFGMNLRSGIENHPHMFYYAVGSICATALTIGIVLIYISRVWPNLKNKRSAQDFAALREFLQHIDDINDIFHNIVNQVGGATKVNREEFEKILRAHPSARFIKKGELELFYRMFDSNRNGFLEINELDGKAPQRTNHNFQQYFN